MRHSRFLAPTAAAALSPTLAWLLPTSSSSLSQQQVAPRGLGQPGQATARESASGVVAAASLSLILGAVCAAGGTRLSVRRRQRTASRRVALCAKSGNDDLLIKAGLRNLLGVEENKMAKRLEEACQATSKLEESMSDLEAKYKSAADELSQANSRAKSLEEEKEQLLQQVKSLSEETKTKAASLETAEAALKAAEAQAKAAAEASEDALAKAKSENTKLAGEVSKLTTELASAAEEAKKLKGQLAEAEKAKAKAAPPAQTEAKSKAPPEKKEAARTPSPAKATAK